MVDHVDPAVAAAFETVMTRLIARQADLSRAVQQQLSSDITELRGDAQIIELLGSSVESNVDTIFHALRHDISLENIKPPTAALEYARRIAQRGVPMNALIRAYRLGHALVLGIVSDEINETAMDPRTSLTVFQRMTSTTFRYIDWITQQVEVVYEEERDRWLANRNNTRTLRVREVLAGALPAPELDPDALTEAIRYPMRRTQLAVVLWWPDGTEHDDGLAELEQFLRATAEHVATQGSPLFIAADQSSGWGWLPLSSAVAPHAADRVREFAAARSGAPAVALGTPLPGVEGFRRSHRQARRAHGVAVAASLPGVTSASDPGLTVAAMLGERQDSAREFVADVLGPLAGANANDARLRETLRVYLRHGGSHTAAAADLLVHYNTVKYRVNRALERRGRPITDDRLDVEMALLLCHWYGAAVLSPG